MKRKLLSLFIIMTIVFTIPVCAASTRTIYARPSIIFSGTEADCIVRIIADKMSDKVVGTMELWQGTTMIDSWDGSGMYTLNDVIASLVSGNYKFRIEGLNSWSTPTTLGGSYSFTGRMIVEYVYAFGA